jgi:hypothetical protein
VGEFIADLRQKSNANHVLVAGTLKRPRSAFRNWFGGDVDLFQLQARRASGVAP